MVTCCQCGDGHTAGGCDARAGRHSRAGGPVLTGLLTATDRAAVDPRGVLAGLGDFLLRSFQDSSQASELLVRWQQQPTDPSLRTAAVDVITEALRANPEFKTGLLSALNLAEQPAVAQPGEPGAATVAAGRDQKFRGNVNIGNGALTVNRQRTIRLGLGAPSPC